MGKNKCIVDHLVIGGGVGGTYLTVRLKNTFKHSIIVQVEKMYDFGGLETSSKIPNGDSYIDLGPVRFYESIHPRVYTLANKMKIPYIEYLPNNNGCVAYLRGTKYYVNNVFPESDKSYNIRVDELNKNPFDIIESNVLKYIKYPQYLYKLDYRIELFKDVKLSNNTFITYAQGDLSQENIERISDILGYSSLFKTDINFLVGSIELLSLYDKSQKQYRFTNGFKSFTYGLSKLNKRKIIEFKNAEKIIKNGLYNLFNTVVLKIIKKRDMWKIYIGSVNVSSPEQINYDPTNIKKIYAKNIYSTMGLSYLENIYDWSPKYLNLLKYNMVDFNPNRFYLYFSKDWMETYGIGYGRSVTTLPAGQIIRYAPNVVMIYTFLEQSSKLRGLIPNNKQIQLDMIQPNEETKDLVEELLNIIKNTFGINELPNVDAIAWASWINPLRTFSGKNKQTFEKISLYDTIYNIMYPFGKNGKFYVLSNNSSFNNSWTEGSLEIVDFFMNNKFNQSLDKYKCL